MHILVTDDEPDIREGMVEWLTAEGHTCDTATNGRECLKKLSTHTYDVLLLDLIMPEMDGEQVLRALQGRFASMARVVASAQDDEIIIRHVLNLGATAYLIKPITPDAFRDVIHKIQTRQTKAGDLNAQTVES